MDLARFKPMTLRSSLWEANVLPSELPSELPCFGEPIIDVPQLLKPVGNGSCFFVQCTFESQAVFGYMKDWHCDQIQSKRKEDQPSKNRFSFEGNILRIVIRFSTCKQFIF